MRRLVVIIAALLVLFILYSLFDSSHVFHLYFALGILCVLVLIGIYDFFQKKHSIKRNFPLIGNFRYLLEFIRPEIHQYFIANNQNERPFSRETRSLVYQRAKNIRDTIPFGTQHCVDTPGYESARHSLNPTVISEEQSRISIGGSGCSQPYSASRLNISAMSFGALSKNAIIALNKGAKLGGFGHNTGEGGLTPCHLAGGGDIFWQIGTGYFGCRTKDGKFCPNKFSDNAQRPEVKMIEIKLSQGAKPSHGGILPAAKVTKEIAEIRGVHMGQDCLSPPQHAEFSNPIELLTFISKLCELSGRKPVGFKMCMGERSQFLGICKAMIETGIYPDFITIDGAQGGTGAAPVEFSNYLGESVNDALIFVNNALVGLNIRDKIRIIASGKITNGFDMLCKLALGANICNSARGMMLSLGCIQSLQCNANTCPTGVATQNPMLMRGLVVKDKYKRVANFHKNTIHSFLELAGAVGVHHLDDLNPSHIYHRINYAECKRYDELYEIIEPGSLLDGNCPKCFERDWLAANATHF